MEAVGSAWVHTCHSIYFLVVLSSIRPRAGSVYIDVMTLPIHSRYTMITIHIPASLTFSVATVSLHLHRLLTTFTPSSSQNIMLAELPFVQSAMECNYGSPTADTGQQYYSSHRVDC